MPDESKLPGYYCESDAALVVVEIGKNNYYRGYSYGEAEDHSNKYPEAKKMTKILGVLHDEFRLK